VKRLIIKQLFTLAALCTLGFAQAAGILYTNDQRGNPQPLRWNTTQPVPVYTDLGVFAYDFDGVTPFISNQRANRIVQFALAQWSSVPSSTLRAQRVGNFAQVPSIGGNVTAANALQVIGKNNGGGLHVIYDTDGSILESIFGVPRDAVLGVASPEIAVDADGDGQLDTIVEGFAILNGYAVWADDPQGERFAGVVTHEFGHAFNLSHSQVNGQMAYFSYPGADLYPGVPGCVGPKHRYDSAAWGGDPMPASLVETMFPFINVGAEIGREMSTVDRPDDIAAISNLYPTAAYRGATGSIGGVLRLRDGRTPYSGINLVARNVADPLGDAVSAMSGDRTQGKIGPDGRFTIRGLKPGHAYVLYTEEIVAGGYPTRPRALVSEAEYWNTAESANPATDRACDATAVTAVGGVTAKADLTFNGYAQGVQYYPLVDATLVDLSKNGGRASGVAFATQFTWDAARGIEVMPPEVLATNGAMSRNGGAILVNADLDRNGISAPALWQGGKLTSLGSLNGDSCGGSGISGPSAAYGFALDDDGRTAVGYANVDANGDGNCEYTLLPEIVPMIWTDKAGMRKLDDAGHDYAVEGWLRAQAISGDGSVVLGETNTNKAMAWVNGGKRIDLHQLHGAVSAYAVNRSGTRAAMDSVKYVDRTWPDGTPYVDVLSNGPIFWNGKAGPDAVTRPAPMRWCVDLPIPPYYDWFTGELVDPCATQDQATIQAQWGLVPMQLNDISDDGRVIVGRAGSFWLNNVTGVLWVEGVGWIRFSDFFRRQGVAEAYRLGLENPLSINGAGNELIGGLLGASATWYVDMKQVFVCQNGQSVQTGFPNGFIEKVRAGAKIGRCEHL
jgi:hypothetical protein